MSSKPNYIKGTQFTIKTSFPLVPLPRFPTFHPQQGGTILNIPIISLPNQECNRTSRLLKSSFELVMFYSFLQIDLEQFVLNLSLATLSSLLLL